MIDICTTGQLYTLRKQGYTDPDPPHPEGFWHFLDRVDVEMTMLTHLQKHTTNQQQHGLVKQATWLFSCLKRV